MTSLFNGCVLSFRKQQLATEYHRKQVLRHYFAEWQHWHCTQVLNRELALAKEETRKKIDDLLRAASLGKLSANGSPGISQLEATAPVASPVKTGKVHCFSFMWSFCLLNTCTWALHFSSLGCISCGHTAFQGCPEVMPTTIHKFSLRAIFIFLNWIFLNNHISSLGELEVGKGIM